MTFVATRTALIAVDLMPRLVDRDMDPHRGADVVARTAEPAAALRRAGGTVVLPRFGAVHDTRHLVTVVRRSRAGDGDPGAV